MKIGDQVFRAVLDTGATLSIVARRLLKTFRKTKTVAIRVGDGRTIHSLGGVDVTICLGDETVTQHCRVLDTDAFDIVIGTNFLRRNPQVKMLSLQRPYSLHCDFGSGLFSVPLELSGRKESGLRYAARTNYRTENYQLARHVLENGLAALQVNLDEIQVELFASQQQHIMQLYCSKQMNNAFRFFWKAMGLAYANPPFSLLAKVLTKIAYEGGRVVMCTPDWGCSGEHAYWRRMLDRMTVGRVQLPDVPIYVPEDSDTAMQASEWASFLSIIDGSLNPVSLCDLDQVLLKEVMAENRGLTLYDLKNRSPEHLSATLTGCESPDDYLEPAAVKEDADDQLSEIASTIPSVDPSCVDLKHSAFLAQLLLEEVDLESTSEPASPVARPPPAAAKPSQEWRGVAHRNLRQEWRGTPTTHHTPPPPKDPSQEWRGPPTTSGSETQPGVAGSSTQEPPPGVARDQPHHTPATTPPTHHTPHTTHHRRKRTPARSGGDRPPPPAAKPSQEWRGVAHRNLRQEWRGTNHTTRQPQPHQHTSATHHTPHSNAANGPQPGVAGTAHHHRQRNPARSGGE